MTPDSSLKHQTVASICADSVLRGDVLSPYSTDKIQIIESPEEKILQIIRASPDDELFGEAVDIISSRTTGRRLNNQQAL